MAIPKPAASSLQTTFLNPTGVTRYYPYLGKQGKKLAPNQTVTVDGDPYYYIRRTDDQGRASMANALNQGLLAIVATPGVVLEDSVTGAVNVTTVTSGTLGVAAPSWGSFITTIPLVVSSVPVIGTKTVAVNSTIAVTFDKAVTGTTFTVTKNGTTSVTGTTAGSNGNKTWTFTPGSNLTADATIVAVVTAGTDGTNTMAPTTITFYVTPTMTIVPANSATGVSASTTVAATFSAAVTGVTLTVTQASPTLAITGTLASGTGGTVWTFTPGSNLNTGKTFTVVISGATDANGSVLATSTTTFST